MPTTRYIYSNGVKIAHVKDDVRTDYLTDALGSITATKNQSQQIVNTYRYKPYGGLLARTGTGPDPKYLWTGNTGSRVTNTRFANQYNVARHYANGPAQWTTVDPLWPKELAYGYVNGMPTVILDHIGLKPETVSQRIRKCKSMSPGHCFNCLYAIYRNPMGFSPQKACDLAKKTCGSNVLCGFCGPGNTKPPPKSCLDMGSLWDYAWSYLHGKCGGKPGADKLAHCYLNCVVVTCTGPYFTGGINICWTFERMMEEDDPEDVWANQLGRKYGVGNVLVEKCLSMCAEGTYDMNVWIKPKGKPKPKQK